MPWGEAFGMSGCIDLDCVRVECYDETLGIFYDEDCFLGEISFGGRYEYTAATYMDPPESDGEIWLEHTEAELMALAQESFDDYDETLLATDDAILDIVREAVEERVWDNPRDYDDTPDPYDEWRDRQLVG